MGKSEGVCTPSSSWRLPQARNVSARKLGADLWETFPVGNMPANILDSPHQLQGASGVRSQAAPPSPKRKQHFHKSSSSSMEDTSINKRESSSRHRHATSTEILLNLLNRIHKSLENQQASTSSHLNALRVELNDSGARIKELLQENVMEEGKSQYKLLSTIQALKVELDDERTCRKDLGKMNRKVAQEVAEANLSFSSTIKELEKERSSRKLLDALCQQFAKGILNRQSHKAKPHRVKDDKLILHLAQAWLDGRIQSVLAVYPNRFIKSSATSNPSCKVHKAKRLLGDLSSDQEENCFCTQSSKSFLLNEAARQIIPADWNCQEQLTAFDQKAFCWDENLQQQERARLMHIDSVFGSF